jgi:predicted nucleotidyltransferase
VDASTNSFEILKVLARHRVEFIVVGMTAAVLQGVPAQTFDLDIVYAITDENAQRLLGALGELEAEFRADFTGRRLRPNASHLLSTGHKLLKTKFGVLDVLGTIEESTRYEDLIADRVSMDVEGVVLHILGLERLIQVKEKAGRPKDKAVLPVLRATLEMVKKG